MKLRKVLTFIILLGLLSRSAPQVLNGRRSPGDSFNYLALIKFVHASGINGHGSGVILSENWVLTAAHNFDPDVDPDDDSPPLYGIYEVTRFVVEVGTKDMKDEDKQTRVFDDIKDVDADPRFYIHPDYKIHNPTDSLFDERYDVALIYLHAPAGTNGGAGCYSEC